MGQKNSGGGPKWVVQQQKLLGTLNCEQQLQARMLMLVDSRRGQDAEQNLQLQVVNEAVKTWFRMYHAVVLLVATGGSAGTNPVNTPEEGFIACAAGMGEFCLENSYKLPAFGLAEDDDFSLSGLQFDKTIEKFSEDYKSDSNEVLGRDFINLNLLAQPIFRDCLEKSEAVVLAPEQVLSDCEESISSLASAHDFSDEYIKEALKRINQLWGAQIGDHLTTVNNWKSEAAAGSLAWWKAKLEIDNNLESQISDLFTNGDSDTKKKIWQVAAVTQLNGIIYTFIFNRFAYPDDEEISHGLDGIVLKYTALNQQAWKDLLAITYAAVAWQIFNQAKLAVDRVRAILD